MRGLSAVTLIPKVHKLENFKNLLTFPQIFESLYNKKVAFIAAIISAIGYLGFTSSQILAGAKLASASFVSLEFRYRTLDNGAYCYWLYSAWRN